MYYTKHISNPRLKRCRRTIIFLLILFLMLAVDAALHSLINGMLTIQAKQLFNDAINTAIQRAADELEPECFVILTENENGEIASIQTDSAAVNSYRAKLSEFIALELDQMEREPIEVPLGTLTGIDFLIGRGPAVKLKLTQVGSITTELKNSFCSAGINQTCHTIDCIVSAEFYAVILGTRTTVSLDTDVAIAQSVIVGNVPDSYTNVNGDQSDTIGRIFDYGDPYGDSVSDD